MDKKALHNNIFKYSNLLIFMKNIKVYIFIVLFLIIFPLVNAASPTLGMFKLNNEIEVKQTCFINGTTCDSCTINSVNLGSTNFLSNVLMQKRTNDFNYTILANLTGTYTVSGFCSYSSVSRPFTYNFEVTPTGAYFSVGQALIFGFIFFVLILFLAGGVYGMNYSQGSWVIMYISLTYISLFCIFFTAYLFSEYYLYSTPILSSIFYILWLVMAFSFLPFIGIISLYIIKKGAVDNLVQGYMKDGFSREEALDMSKGNR